MIGERECELWAKMPQYTQKLQRTTDNVCDMLSRLKNPYVAFSCGKDSSVLADIVLDISPSTKCRFISSGETRIIHNVDDVIDYFKCRHGMDLEEIVFDRVFSEIWEGCSFDMQRKAGRRDIQNVDNTDYDGVFLGLRKEESRGRQITLITRNTNGLPRNMYKYVNRDYYRMCPLADWKTIDIGAYIVTHGIPVLKWYSDFGFDGRTTARLTGDSLRQNTLMWIKINNPNGYHVLLKRFPELSVYG